jgi:hypothetical protein
MVLGTEPGDRVRGGKEYTRIRSPKRVNRLRTRTPGG